MCNLCLIDVVTFRLIEAKLLELYFKNLKIVPRESNRPTQAPFGARFRQRNSARQ